MCLDKTGCSVTEEEERKRWWGTTNNFQYSCEKQNSNNNKFNVETVAKACMSATGHETVASRYDL